jgi:heme/copper-type cytochrome/quinol oxidase subunit 2
MKRWILSAILILAAGCAGAPVREGAVTVAPGERLVELKAESYYFTPAYLAVPADRPVVLRIHNEATLIPHSFVLEGAGGNIIVRQSLAKGGDTLVRLAPLPAGAYTFYCDKSFMGMSHRKKGMVGKLEALPGK